MELLVAFLILLVIYSILYTGAKTFLLLIGAYLYEKDRNDE